MDNFRRDPSSVPSHREMEAIFETEAQRSIPPSKVDQHFASINPFLEFLSYLDFDTSAFTLDKSWEEALEGRGKTQQDIVKLILAQDISDIKERAQNLYQYLAEEDIPQNADLIVAFGAKTLERAKSAVELYKKSLAPKILFSGGHAIWQDTEKQEADIYKELAVKEGVPDENILTESNSITVPDNVRSSLNLLDDIGLRYNKIILVNSPYVQRRGYGHMQKYTSEGTILYRVNCATREGLRENDWFTNEEGIKYVINEFGKIWIGLITNTI